MVEVTEAAVAAIESMREEAGAPPSAGLRIQAVQQPTGDVGIGLTFTDEAEENDEVGEQSGLKVFLQEELTEHLDGAVIDAQSTDEGTELVVKMEPPVSS